MITSSDIKALPVARCAIVLEHDSALDLSNSMQKYYMLTLVNIRCLQAEVLSMPEAAYAQYLNSARSFPRM